MTDTNIVTYINTKTVKVEGNMTQYLSSIKQISTQEHEGDNVIITLNINPESEEHNELMGIDVETSNLKVKTAFSSLSDKFSFDGTLDEFNKVLLSI